MSTVTDMIVRGWANFLARPQGAFNFRFILQPTIAAILALRAGYKDAAQNRPARLSLSHSLSADQPCFACTSIRSLSFRIDPAAKDAANRERTVVVFSLTRVATQAICALARQVIGMPTKVVVSPLLMRKSTVRFDCARASSTILRTSAGVFTARRLTSRMISPV